MELIQKEVPSAKQYLIAPLGDFQWSGPKGSTALSHLKQHVKRCVAAGAYFVGMGDYTDFMSPSNRAHQKAAALYDTAEEVIEDKGLSLVHDIYALALQPTKGRWLGLVEGHHFYALKDGTTTDSTLAELVGCPFLGTSAIIRLFNKNVDVTMWIHHGVGGGTTPGAPLNTLFRVHSAWQKVDLVLMGHTTKLATARLSSPYPDWEHEKGPTLRHRDVLLVNCGGFSKSNVQGHRSGPIPRGDYAEQKMLMPSPLSAPLIHIYPATKFEAQRITVET